MTAGAAGARLPASGVDTTAGDVMPVVPRPASRSPVAHAKTLVERGEPIAQLALEVAERWAAAR